MISENELKELFNHRKFNEINNLFKTDEVEFTKSFTKLLGDETFSFQFSIISVELNNLLRNYLKNKLNNNKLNLSNNERSSIFYIKDRLQRKFRKYAQINDEIPEVQLIKDLYNKFVKINKPEK